MASPLKVFVIFAVVCGTGLAPSQALAHHGPGQGAGEGLRALGALGGNPAPRQRAAGLVTVSRSSDEPNLNAATSYELSLLAQIRAMKRLLIGAELPFALVDQADTTRWVGGMGEARASLNVQLGQLDELDAPRFLLGVAVTFPTRTYHYQSDPGRRWVVAPSFRYADSWRSLVWYALTVFPWEDTPAGMAWEATVAAGLGVRVVPVWTLSAGANGVVRLLNWCRTTSGTKLCPEGRVTETDREQGATRVYAQLASTVDLGARWSLLFNAQLPLTDRRDIEWSVGGGVEFRF